MRINNESKTYNKYVLKNINLDIDKGLYKIEGDNGAGKSTLIQLLSGLETFDSGFKSSLSGDILFLDTNPLGVIPFTIEENLRLLWDTFKIKPSEKEKEAVRRFFKGNIGDSFMSASTGTKSKLGLSLLLVKNWDYIFIDETLSTLDSKSIDIVAQRLLSLRNDSTIIYVSHNLSHEGLLNNSKRITIETGVVYEN